MATAVKTEKAARAVKMTRKAAAHDNAAPSETVVPKKPVRAKKASATTASSSAASLATKFDEVLERVKKRNKDLTADLKGLLAGTK